MMVVGCQKATEVTYSATDATLLHRCERQLTELIIHDIFSPPVSSRVYVYPSLAAYEAARFAKAGSPSITANLRDFEAIPAPEGAHDFRISAVRAFCQTAKRVVFSKPEIQAFEDQLLAELKDQTTEEIFNRSVEFGTRVSDAVIKRLSTDNYQETRGMDRYEVKALPGLWVPTPPDYADGVEPHWPQMKTMALDSNSQCDVALTIPYNEGKSSDFWKELTEVYEMVNRVKEGSDEMDILTFWDDNPFVSRHKGHLMFQDKKMTPGGHWMAINRIMAIHNQLDFVATANSYAVTSVTLYDAFISCWNVKYSTARVRPETVINDKVDKKWVPHLVTPPFPAFTSGHSTVSAAAAEALTFLYGDAIAYTDSTEREFGLSVRNFSSFREAALEASISRVYAGIHYRSDCELGNVQGRKVGAVVFDRLTKGK